MGSITRTNNLVTLTTSGGTSLTCDALYGGIALSLKKGNGPNLISPVAGAGEGMQAVYDFGGDPTAGSANGPMAYPLATRTTTTCGTRTHTSGRAWT